MKRLIAAAILGLTVVATVSTSASAFQCLARGTNGVSTWGYGLIAGRAQAFAYVIVVPPAGLIVISPSAGKLIAL